MHWVAVAICLLSAPWSSSAALTFTTPEGWVARPTTSSMRVAEFTLPRAAGDTEDASLILYFFGGSGGGVDANLDRWIGQMSQPDGRPSAAVASTAMLDVNGLEVTLVDVSGTYVAEVTPGSPERHSKPRYRLRAGVVATPEGPYFIKLVGPERTVERWNDAYFSFVNSLKH